MNTEALLSQFNRISAAHDAAPHLRRFIYQLAVRGKLVTREPGDTHASELVDLLQSAKAFRTKRSSGQSIHPVSMESLVEAVPVPRHWAWLRLADIGTVSGGMTPSKDRPEYWGGRINWYSPKDIKSDELIDSEMKITHLGANETGLQLYPPGCLFIVARSGILKRTFPVGINRMEATANQDLKVLNPFVQGMERYLQIMFIGMTDFILSKLVKTGTTVQSLKYEEFESQFFPLPPLTEQRRIVAKVDELMILCDGLERTSRERQKLSSLLTVAAHDQLNKAVTADGFSTSTPFFIGQLRALTANVGQIGALRHTILSLAIRGKLTSQNSGEEPASNLLNRIHAERSRLIKNSEMQIGKGVRPVHSDRASFGIPESWSWVSLGEIAFGFKYGTSTKCSYEIQGEPVLRIPNVRGGRIDLRDLKYGPLAERETSELRLRIGDILMVRSNGSLDLVGRAARIEDSAVNYCYAGYLVRVRTSSELLDTRYLVLALSTTHVRNQIEVPIRSAVGLKNINTNELSSLTFPLPPLAEQKRIVEKVDALMALCDRLEESVRTSDDRRQDLLEAVINESLYGGAVARELSEASHG
jgi:type I restriction enzyme S subunit